VTRQAARKVADGLEQRGYATTERDSRDTRQLNVTLTQLGRDYARAITAVISELNREVAGRVSPDQLAAGGHRAARRPVRPQHQAASQPAASTSGATFRDRRVTAWGTKLCQALAPRSVRPPQ